MSHCPKHLHKYFHLILPTIYVVGTISIPILKIRKLRQKGGKSFSQQQMTSKWCSQDLNPGSPRQGPRSFLPFWVSPSVCLTFWWVWPCLREKSRYWQQPTEPKLVWYPWHKHAFRQILHAPRNSTPPCSSGIQLLVPREGSPWLL